MKPNTFKNQFRYIMIPRITRVSALEYEKHFKDKVCLVTGATSGIGKAVCKRLIAAGISYIINDRCICNYGWTHSE
jgi:FlaA1/EpsC-like NDP-sugar epimerase